MPRNAIGAAASTIRVWDVPVRVFHWLVVVLLGVSWITAKGPATWMVWHMRAGYAVLFLVLFRLLWGIWGSRHARFGDFVRGPRAVWIYARALLRGRPPHWTGHNPLGGWMVLLLLLLLAVQAGTGLFATDDIMTDGPLRAEVSRATAKLLTRIHHLNFNLLLAAAGLHVAAVLAYLVVIREDLITPMFSGRKAGIAQASTVRVSWWRTAVTAAVAAAIVWRLVG